MGLPRSFAASRDTLGVSRDQYCTDRVARGTEALARQKIVGPNLSGSLAYGVFVPEKHDIDSQAVVRTPVVRQNCWSVRPRDVTIYNPLGNPLILKSLVILAKDSLEE